MTKTILLTAANEDSEGILNRFSATDFEVLHTPLEVYHARKDDTEISNCLEDLESYENIVYNSKRNAGFFLDQIDANNKKDTVQNSLNLTVDEPTFAYLENQGIAAVHPQNGSKPIDLVELMLRLKRLGKTLYPCGSHKREDFPGFLEELDIPVTELDVFDLEGPSNETLSAYQKKIAEEQPEIVIFHSRRSVNRTLAAFPDLDYNTLRIISADKGITKKLKEKNISVDDEAEGSWESIADLM